MSEELEISQPYHPAETLTWFQSWKLVLTDPSVATFEEIIRDPNASVKRAFTWLLITSMIGLGLSTIVDVLLDQLPDDSVFLLICSFPVFAVATILIFTVYAGVTHGIAKLLGGKGSYPLLLYAYVSFTAPLTLITPSLNSVDHLVVNCLSAVVGLYSVVLSVTALKVVHQLSWGKSIAAIILPGILIVIIVLFFGLSVNQL